MAPPPGNVNLVSLAPARRVRRHTASPCGRSSVPLGRAYGVRFENHAKVSKLQGAERRLWLSFIGRPLA